MKYAHVFCIFDRDGHDSYEEAINRIIGLNKSPRKKAQYHVITSNRSAEIWLLMYNRVVTKSYNDKRSLLKDVKKLDQFSNYNKSYDIYRNSTRENIETAFLHAQKSLEKRMKEEPNGTQVHDVNPSTLIYLVIAELEKMYRVMTRGKVFYNIDCDQLIFDPNKNSSS